MNQSALFERSERPFGYLFAGDPNEPAPDPDSAGLGLPLLDPLETQYSHQFFEDFGSERAPLPNLGPFAAASPWASEPYENFHGVLSALPSTNETADFGLIANQLPDQIELDAAAAFLIDSPQHTHARTATKSTAAESEPTPHHGRLEGSSRLGAPASPFSSQGHQLDTQQPSSGTAPRKVSSSVLLPEARTAAGQPGPALPPNGGLARLASAAGDDRVSWTFGSDVAFQAPRYAPGPAEQPASPYDGRMMGMLAGLEVDGARMTHRKSSTTKASSKRSRAHGKSALAAATGSTQGAKRLKESKNSSTTASTDAASTTHVRPPESSYSTDAQWNVVANETGSEGSCAAPTTGEARIPRQNLTEEEKKQNHIRSEQKRRNQIKAGFDSLLQLLPDGHAAGPSKCIILAQAVDWLAMLLEGNKQLRLQLETINDASRL